MGQHKYNQTAILAKDGKLPPKEDRKTRTEARKEIEAEMYNLLFRRTKGISEILLVNSILKNNKY